MGGRGIIADVGKALGGGGVINAAAWTRGKLRSTVVQGSSGELGTGPASDYDLWADVVKDPPWCYEGMLPYFRMLETHHDEARNDEQHGYDGPVHAVPLPMNHPKGLYPLRESVRQAWEQASVDYISDGNTGHPLGLTDLEDA